MNHYEEAINQFAMMDIDCNSDLFYRKSKFNYDPYYNYSLMHFTSLVETSKAFRFTFIHTELWVAKKLCKNLNFENKTVYIWSRALRQQKVISVRKR
jgi:hypothetical protein